MAGNRIKGITIEIDGNTTKLTDALKKADQAAREAAKAVSGIEKALKFNPGNTELVAQQQRNLQEQIEATKEKLKILEDADASMKDQLNNKKISISQYEGFRQEVIETESKLGNLEKKLKSSQEEQEKLGKAQQAMATLLSAAGKEIDDYGSLIGEDLVAQYKKGEGSSKEMERALQSLGDELLGTGQDSEKLQEAIQNISNGADFNNVKNEIQETADSMGKIGDAAEDSEKAMRGAFAGDILMDLADQAQAVVDKFKEIAEVAVDYANEQSQGMTSIQANLGTTREETEQLGEVMDEVMGQGVVESSGEAAEAIVQVKSAFSDLNDVDLASVTDKLITLSERTGTDLPENVQAVKVLMKEFGTSSSEAMDLLAAGYQNNLNYSGDFTDTIREYAPLLADAGMGAQEFLDLLVSGMEGGALNTDKTADAVKELQIRLGDGSFEEHLGTFSDKTAEVFHGWQDGKNTISEVMQSIQEDLQKMDPAQQQAALSALATQFEDLGADASLSLLGVESGLGNVAGAADQVNQKTPGEAWTGNLNELKDLLQPLGDDIINLATGALTWLVDKIQALANWFNSLNPVLQIVVQTIGIFAGAIVAITPIIVGLLGVIAAVKGVLAVLGGAFGAIAAPVGIVIAAIAALIAIGVALVSNWDTIKAAAVNVWNAITSTISSAWESIKGAVTNAINVVKSTMENVWNGIKQTTSNIWNGIKSFISNTWEGIKGAVTNAINAVKSTVGNVWNGIKSVTSSVWNGIKGVISTVWGSIKGAVKGAIDTVKSTVENVWNGIKQTTSNIWNGVKDTISGVVDGIKEKVVGVFNTVKNKVTGIWNGIISFFKNIHIPLPHFKMSGSINPFSGNFPPRISISWYKQGGIFDKPSLIGVGEAGSEAVVPTHKLDAFFEQALDRIGATRQVQPSEGDIMIHIDKMEVRDDQDIPKLAQELKRYVDRERRLKHV